MVYNVEHSQEVQEDDPTGLPSAKPVRDNVLGLEHVR